MSSEKRAAADSFGSSQLVKRQKSDANLANSRSVAVVNGTVQNGALIQTVCPHTCCFFFRYNMALKLRRRQEMADFGGLDRYLVQVVYKLL